MFATQYNWFPWPTFKRGHAAIKDLIVNHASYRGVAPTKSLRPSRHAGSGVTVSKPASMQPGLTFITGIFDGKLGMSLVDEAGKEVHRWHAAFSKVFPNPAHLTPRARPHNDWDTQIHGAIPLPDGSVVFNFEYAGMAKLDQCGEIVWALPYNTHHSLDQNPDGSFWTAATLHPSEKFKNLATIKHSVSQEALLQVSADGKILRKIPLLPTLLKAGLAGTLLPFGTFAAHNPTGDLTHLNDVEVLKPEMAAAFPMFAAGDLLLSLRNLNLLVVLDPGNGRVKWRQTGPWHRQHDPDFQPDGRITVFDNRTDFTDDGSIFGGSAVTAIRPPTQQIQELYVAPKGQRFYTPAMGKHQRLANGNLLLTESESGRIIEVSPSGSIVWEYIARYDKDQVILTSEGSRYAPDYFTVPDWSLCAA